MSARLAEARAALAQVRAERHDEPPSLFDDPLTPVLDAVAANAGEEWITHALDAIRSAALIYSELTVDQVWPYVTEAVHDRKAMGAAMRRAAMAQLIERQHGEFRISERPDTHGRPVALWRSRIYQGGEQ